MEYYIGTAQELQAVDDQIVANCPDGGFVKWAVPKVTISGDLVSIKPTGSNSYKEAKMNAGITASTVTDPEFPVIEV